MADPNWGQDWNRDELAALLAAFVARGPLLGNLRSGGLLTASECKELHCVARVNSTEAGKMLLDYLRDRQWPTFNDFCDILNGTDGCQDLYRKICYKCKCSENDPSSEVKETPQTIRVLLKNVSRETRRFSSIVSFICWIIRILSYGAMAKINVESTWLASTIWISLTEAFIASIWSIFTFTSFTFGRRSVDKKSRVLGQSLPVNSRFSGKNSFNGRVPDSLPGEVNSALIHVVAKLLKSTWEELASLLTGEISDILHYRRIADDNVVRAMMFLNAWKLSRGREATVNVLIEACEKCGIHPETIIAAYSSFS